MECQMPIFKQDYKVLVRCFTFNQSKYIVDALNGFTMQQTNFPFVCLIIDDASTDGEQEVIKAFMDNECDMLNAEYYENEVTNIILAKSKSNTNCTMVVYLLKKNLYGNPQKKELYEIWRHACKYEAICEGDDYWTDERKLQKQVDWMEKNPNYTLCFHSAKIISEFPDPGYLHCGNIEDRDYSSDELLEQWIAPTASFMYKLDILNYKIKNSKRILNGDIFIVLKSGALGKIRGMKDTMSCYRIHNGGVTYGKKEKLNRILRYPDHFECIKENFPNVASLYVKSSLMNAYYNRAHYQSSTKFKIKDFWKSFCASPIEFAKKVIKIL